MGLPTWVDNTVRVSIGTVVWNYVAVETTAPCSYDGFETIALEPYGKGRIVLIEEDNYEWQVGRYESGSHTTNILDDAGIVAYAQNELIRRMKNADG